MKRVKNFIIAKESFEDMCEARRFNPCLEITFRDRRGQHTHKISAGYDDEIHVYREHGETFILTQNQRLGYVGLEVFNGAESVGEIFLQGDNVIETLGRDDLAPFTIIRRLKDYVYSDISNSKTGTILMQEALFDEEAEICISCGNIYKVVWLKEGDDYNDFGCRHCPFCGLLTDEFAHNGSV